MVFTAACTNSLGKMDSEVSKGQASSSNASDVFSKVLLAQQSGVAEAQAAP